MNKTTILVIDDEQSFLDVITNSLKSENYKVIQALDGKMGIKVANKFIPDIIICDWEMPVMDGIDAIKNLKQNELTKDIPIIMATGKMTSANNLNTALKAGAIDYIRKPIEPIELIARINSALILSKSIAEIKEQNSELEKLNATKNKFFSIIAHDLRNPFNVIFSYVKLITSYGSKLSEKDKLKLNDSLSLSAKSGFSLLQNLLTWARSQQNQITINIENINLKELISESVAPYLPFAETKDISVYINVESDLTIKVDHFTIFTTIGNVINNAIKFTPMGGIITLSAEKSNKVVVLGIRDTGVGITQEKIEELFRIDKNHSTLGTNNEKGTGLGLILCKELVEKNGGTIRAESEKAVGSHFIITLPCS